MFEPEPCYKCNGTGKVIRSSPYIQLDVGMLCSIVEVTCEECGGTGERAEPNEKASVTSE